MDHLQTTMATSTTDSTTSAPITFSPEEVTAWVQACDEEGRLRQQGASTEQIQAAQLRSVMGLAQLIAPAASPLEMLSFVSSLMREQPSSPPVELPEDPEDVTTQEELREVQQGFLTWEAGEVDDDGNEVTDEDSPTHTPTLPNGCHCFHRED